MAVFLKWRCAVITIIIVCDSVENLISKNNFITFLLLALMIIEESGSLFKEAGCTSDQSSQK